MKTILIVAASGAALYGLARLLKINSFEDLKDCVAPYIKNLKELVKT